MIAALVVFLDFVHVCDDCCDYVDYHYVLITTTSSRDTPGSSEARLPPWNLSASTIAFVQIFYLDRDPSNFPVSVV